MVRRRSVGRRGQMILVGSVLLAVLIVGLAVLVNTVVFTSMSASSVTDTQLDDARAFDSESRKSIRSIVLRVNHGHRNINDTGKLRTWIQRNVTNYTIAVSQAYARSDAQYAAINDTKPSDVVLGRRIVQAKDSNMSAPGTGAANWEPIDSTNKSTIGWFTMNVDVGASVGLESSPPFKVIVTNSSGDRLELWLQKSAGDLEVVSQFPGGSESALCDPTSNRVILDLATGESPMECTGRIVGIDDAADFDDGNLSIEYENGDKIIGQYEFVANQTVEFDDGSGTPVPYNDSLRCTNATSVSQPCTAYAVWELQDVQIQYYADQTQYSPTYDLLIYPTQR